MKSYKIRYVYEERGANNAYVTAENEDDALDVLNSTSESKGEVQEVVNESLESEEILKIIEVIEVG